MAEKLLFIDEAYKRQFGSYVIEVDGQSLEYCRITQGEVLAEPFRLVATISEEAFKQAVSSRRIRYLPA